ncbi:MAG TPA: 3,4-dihydroxy-2-butanone-4-phosphate synthase, partial [Methanobacterium sp.]|nr:3,4-dihydroxy-2-butanone-4-phosphate synthase [Methanobacterium sp.]
TPVGVCCEMMDDKTGNSLPTSEVEKYAEKEGLLFLSGEEVIKAYREFKNI